MKETLRQEKKYLLSYDQFCRMDAMLSKLLHPDQHNGRHGYLVRSLYFDTMQEKDFHEKEDGLELRRKIRLRTYDPAAETALLEMKQKQGENQKKRSLKISRQDAAEMIKGRYGCLSDYEEKFAAECYGLMNVQCYRPKAVVEYRRKAYVVSENQTRITFDYDVRATECSYDLFAPNLKQYPVLDPYLVILEVKYNGFLLSYIKQILSIDGKSQTSVSKYSLSRTAGLHYRF